MCSVKSSLCAMPQRTLAVAPNVCTMLRHLTLLIIAQPAGAQRPQAEFADPVHAFCD